MICKHRRIVYDHIIYERCEQGLVLRVAIGFKRAVVGFRGPSAASFLQMYGDSTPTWVLVPVL